jgi:MoaA/NifB/PqqE/SkfB family radical SAM enzyme
MSKCAAFWKHTNIRGDNRVFPCCRFKTPVDTFDGNIEKVLHSEAYERLRLTDVTTLPQCSKCMHEEANGKKSLRQEFNEQYDTDSVELEFLEIGFDNICNLTCDGCNAEFSSSWAKKETGKLSYTEIDDITEVPNTIKKILFLGGEPLMTSRHTRLLKLVDDPSKVDVIYNTNGTFLIEDISLLKQFNTVTFILSIDGYKDLNDKVRSGSKWQDITRFIEQVEMLEFNLEINTVLHLNNWHGIKELAAFINSLEVNWTVNVLTYPQHLDIANYSNKQEIINLIKQTSIPNKDYVIRHLS